MKKILQTIIVAILLCVPIGVYAKEGISNYFIDLTVEENGDVTVEELFILEGKEYNGYERIIDYIGASSPFDGSLESFASSGIYNGDSLEIKEVKSIAVSSHPTFSDLKKEGTKFHPTNFASNGEFGKYILKNTANGKSIRIYNHSSKQQKGFYIKYVITNMAVVHNDIAEVGFNLFSDKQFEAIDNIEMRIHTRGNDTEIRAWGHGVLWGETSNISKEEVHLNIKDLDARQAVDIRFVFGKSVVPYSMKKSNVDGLPSILEIEAQKAEEANAIREQVRRREKINKSVGNFFSGCGIIWGIGLIFVVLHIYHKYDKEYKNTLPSKYYREFPDTYGPEILGYLLHKQISPDDLSASILYLIYKKAISFESLPKNDYRLVNLHAPDITETEQKLLDWLFDNQEETTLSSLKKQAKISYEDFLNRYEAWKIKATKQGKSYQFFEDSNRSKIGAFIYSLIGFFLATILFRFEHILLAMLLMCSAGCSIIYFATYQKRTKAGSEAYYKWMGLKNFMNDFGNFKEKELPEIVLWEKYLVYAVSLGCAKKLAKTMEIKMNEMNIDGQALDETLLDFSRMNVWFSFNRVLTGTITSAVGTAHTSHISNSKNSSSGGFGGGFSGGGGSFGGGGGGSRF